MSSVSGAVRTFTMQQVKSMKIAVAFGTRPEAIKMAPIVKELTRRGVDFSIIVTGQHRELLDQKLDLFGIKPHHDLDVMQIDQDLFQTTSLVLQRIKPVLAQEAPDLLLVQGDTTTTFAASLAAFYLQIPIGHVEAGLRTWNRNNPYPEELNRQLTTRLASLHFAPTTWARANLLREGVSAEEIHVTGNPVIDALLDIAAEEYRFENALLNTMDYATRKVVVMTVHRRESFGEPMKRIFQACRELVESDQSVELIYPVHPNPQVKTMASHMLSGTPRVHLIEPLDYRAFVHLMKQSYLILTDSGGIQEEAPSLRKPVLVLRETTERPEAIEAGTAKLVGTSTASIVSAATQLLQDRKAYGEMITQINPYGDGTSGKQIVDIVLSALSGSSFKSK